MYRFSFHIDSKLSILVLKSVNELCRATSTEMQGRNEGLRLVVFDVEEVVVEVRNAVCELADNLF